MASEIERTRESFEKLGITDPIFGVVTTEFYFRK
jgi:hypothetical protein